MSDQRDQILANKLLDYSTRTSRGDVVYIEIKGVQSLGLGKALIRGASKRGATPFWFYNDESLLQQWLIEADHDQFQCQAEMHLELMQRADVYIGIRGSDNPFDLAEVSDSQMEQYNQYFYRPVHAQERVNNTRWVVLRYPNNAMAQLAEMSQSQFADFYYRVCCANYASMSTALGALASRVEAASKIRILGPDTDLTFSKGDTPVVPCDGRVNIPDGEVYTAPLRESVEGRIRFNVPSLYQGILFQDVSFVFEAGKIVSADCSSGNQVKLNQILDSDEGARFIGEFAIGVNPFIQDPIKDILFDEKIAGSFHFTPGQCYDNASNGNSSCIHWDLVQIQRDEFGGGELWLDDELFRKDGVFTDAALEKSFSTEVLQGKELAHLESGDL